MTTEIKLSLDLKSSINVDVLFWILSLRALVDSAASLAKLDI